MCHHERAVLAHSVPRLRSAIPARETAARHIQADAMSLLKDIAGGPQIDLVLIHPPRLNQRWRLAAGKITISCSDNAIGQILRVSIGMDIDESRHKISIDGAGRSPQPHADWPRHLHIL